jgi:ribosome-binding protein aMBF1 (putative translation factor)
VLLTVFRKTRQHGQRQIGRAVRAQELRERQHHARYCGGDPRKAGMVTGYHTRWVRPPEQPEDPERIAIREALAFGKAVRDQRRALGLSVADLAGRADMTADEIEASKKAAPSPPLPCCGAWPPPWTPTCA